MTTLSDAFAAAAAPETEDTAEEDPRVHARMRTREYRSLPVVGKVRDATRTAAADLRSAWWLPASMPTLGHAWADRMPDRDRVPGDNGALYVAWVAYNHTVGLIVPAVALLLVGALTPLVWTSRHPARMLLAAPIVTALIVLLAL